MINIEFVTGDTFVSNWCGRYAEYTPVYAIIDGKKRLVRNISHTLSGDTFEWRQYSDKKSKEEVEKAKNNLMVHDGKYIAFISMFDNPFEFVNWIMENNYTLEVVRNFFEDSSNGDFIDFHGNLCEYSCAFHYRIYDYEMLDKLKNIVSGMKQRIR